MGTMYRLKAYFGMVPAEELTEYVDEPVDRYSAPRRSRDGDDRWPSADAPTSTGASSQRIDHRRDDPRWEDKRWTDPGWDERGRDASSWDDDASWDDDRYPGDDHGSPEPSRSDDPRRGDPPRDDRGPRRPVPPDGRPGPQAAGRHHAFAGQGRSGDRPPRAWRPSSPPVRWRRSPRWPVRSPRSRRATGWRRWPASPTLSPRSYKEARTIGERYRDGQPVIMNLTELDAADAKRLVDFAPAWPSRSAVGSTRSPPGCSCSPLLTWRFQPTTHGNSQNAGSSARIELVSLAIQFVLYYVLFFFWLLLIGRIVVELVRSFARQWVPAGSSAVALELIFTATDPPVKLLRRVIPVVRIGGVGLDLSIMVLLLVVFILMNVAQPTPL
jgi:YggT family protein